MRHALHLLGTLDMRWVLVGLLVVLDGWAIGLIARSKDPRADKSVWTGIVIFCPIVGCLLWYVLGPKPPRPGVPGSGAPARDREVSAAAPR